MNAPLAQTQSTSFWLKGVAVLAMLFGALTLFSAGNILFGADRVRELAGAYIPFVVWFNFAAGFLYILTAVGIWLGRKWTFNLAIFIAAATIVTALAFGIQVSQGAAFEMRTVGALAIRTGFWSVIAWVLFRKIVRP